MIANSLSKDVLKDMLTRIKVYVSFWDPYGGFVIARFDCTSVRVPYFLFINRQRDAIDRKQFLKVFGRLTV